MRTDNIADALRAQYDDDQFNEAVKFVNSLASKAPPEEPSINGVSDPNILIPTPQNRANAKPMDRSQPGFTDVLDRQTAQGRALMQDAATEFRDTPGVMKYLVPGSSQLKLALGALDTIAGTAATLGGSAAATLAQPFVALGILDGNQVSDPEKAARDLRAMMDVAAPEFTGFGMTGPRVASGLTARNALQVEGANAAARIEERGQAFAGQSAMAMSGVDPKTAGKALANAVDTTIAKAGQIVGGKPSTELINQKEIDAIRLVSEQVDEKISLDATSKQRIAEDTVRRIKEQYSPEQGFLPVNVTGGKFVTTKTGDVIFEPKFKEPPYAFHIPPEGVSKNQWRDQIASKMVKDVQDVITKAQSGDAQARFILSQANWYRAMRTRLREEFGGLGDTFADLLGTTSAQTGVEQNWDNALEILRRFSRGEYDKELDAYASRVSSGQTVDGKTLTQLHKDGKFPLITKAAGQLFNANSPTSMGALLNMFRDIKVGAAPKTPNFTGNLIGYSNKATIDVWAARYLRNAAGLPYIPPPAEKAVAGKHLTGSTLHSPKIGTEFGFGQEVFSKAASDLNASGVVKKYDPQLGAIGEDDLQAVVWFIEKDKWTKNGWTSKAGEGGSLDFEAGLAGASDPARVKELRRTLNKGFKSPVRKPAETDEEFAARVEKARADFAVAQSKAQQQLADLEASGSKTKKVASLREKVNAQFVTPLRKEQETDASYSARVQAARAKYDATKDAAQKELESLAAPLERTVLGVSAERPGARPSNYMQAELAAEFDDVVREDKTVEAYKLTNTYGRFMNTNERALDAEFVTRQNFNPAPLKKRLVEMGKRYDQDAVFVSKVVRDGNLPNARPGIEIYFKDRQAADFANRVSDKLTQYGIDGFTFVTDARQQDRINVQAMSGGEDVAGVTGLRLQYIPEFDDTYDPARRVEIMNEKERLYRKVLFDLLEQEDGISSANVIYYDTEVFKRDQYDEYLGRAGEVSGGGVRVRQQDRPDAPQSTGGTSVGPVRKGALPDR